MTAPTREGIRNDEMGHGHYGARRQGKKHMGVDYLCTPGHVVMSPISGEVVRIAKPYSNDDYSGLVIKGKHIMVKLFYLEPIEGIVGKYVQYGDAIGHAQDISYKWGDKMKPHIHLEVVSVDPEVLISMLG